MTDSSEAQTLAAPAEVRKKGGISLVWIVPIVALLVGGWLVFKAMSEKGPVVTMTFSTAEGLEAGKTKIKFKDVVVGQVEDIRVGDDLTHVVVTAELVKDYARFLNDKTRFWVARAQIRGGTASGLSTLLSGAYIGIDPALGGQPTTSFAGLEVPPVITSGLPGRHFWLKAKHLGSLNVGVPVYYRQIQVGQVVSYGFAPDGQTVDVQVFVGAPHDAKVTKNTRFWNASGLDVSLSAEGLKIDTESLISIISGGLAFDVPDGLEPGEVAGENSVFNLYPNRESIQEKSYSVRRKWMVYFDQSVRGLSPGAPVEIYGIKIGEVTDIDLVYDEKMKDLRVPVVLSIEPERIANVLKAVSDRQGGQSEPLLRWFVEERNLRAQLKTGNLLTGQMLVDLGFYPEEPKAQLAHENGMPVIPSMGGSIEQIQESIARITRSLEKVPFEKIGKSLDQLLRESSVTVREAGTFVRRLDGETAPMLQSSLGALQGTLEELQRTLGKDSPLNYNLKKTLEELTLTLRSLRELSTAIENQPQSLLFGKGEKKDE
ncbi:paraquat-inducible protein B [Desulfomicrobium norvegicum]|uniref:Paraquat-inducible protein B n=1 Tax=Desulfomicrobium norvegicum (strain DSM 1741 / NCIMB 8310) TaxID=52561 RepID=A0A8G2F887_DESNO|nr:MlaD family protein [Desulfomicrobium norvegicum]SFL79795.1 paraquat-inducible protein B [Desulfomicrobium norvegicum]